MLRRWLSRCSRTKASRMPRRDRRRHLPLLHGLHWLTANLAVTQPLLLCLDDAHWADEPSLRFLHYLAGRIEELPVLALVATRSTAPEAPVMPVEAMRDEPAVGAIRPSTLAAESVARLLRDAFGAKPVRFSFTPAPRPPAATPSTSPNWRGRCALMASHPRIRRGADRRGQPRGGHPKRPRSPRTAPPHLRRRSQDGPLSWGIRQRSPRSPKWRRFQSSERSRPARLSAAEILADATPLRFTHPLVGSAIYLDLPMAERSRRHGRAARTLHKLGAAPERVAAHLLRSEPAADTWVVAELRVAADEAVSQGAAGAAISYLTRARSPSRRRAMQHSRSSTSSGQQRPEAEIWRARSGFSGPPTGTPTSFGESLRSWV